MRRVMAQAPNIMIRRARAEDADIVARLHADSWRRHYRGAYSDGFLDGDVLADRLQVWSDRLANPDGSTVTFLAEDNSVLVGFVHLVFDDDPDWGSLVDNLHVVWTRKRDGIGTRLMAEAAAAVVEHGQAGLYLWVLEQNTAAQAFYRAKGGICTGRHLVAAPGGNPDRLNGGPIGVRYAWADAAVLTL